MTDDPFTVLGLPADSSDEAIRGRYLELVREFSPERAPERFAAIRAAYDALRDSDARLAKLLFVIDAPHSPEDVIRETLCTTPRRRVSLTELTKLLPKL